MSVGGVVHQDIKAQAESLLKERGFSEDEIQDEYKVRIGKKLFIVDVVGLKDEMAIAIECGIVKKNKLIALETYFDEVIHLPYLSEGSPSKIKEYEKIIKELKQNISQLQNKVEASIQQEEVYWFNETYIYEEPHDERHHYEKALLFFTDISRKFNGHGIMGENLTMEIKAWILKEILNLSLEDVLNLVIEGEEKIMAFVGFINELDLNTFVSLEVHGNIIEKLIVIRLAMDGGKLLDELDRKFPNGDDLEIIINGIQCYRYSQNANEIQ